MRAQSFAWLAVAGCNSLYVECLQVAVSGSLPFTRPTPPLCCCAGTHQNRKIDTHPMPQHHCRRPRSENTGLSHECACTPPPQLRTKGLRLPVGGARPPAGPRAACDVAWLPAGVQGRVPVAGEQGLGFFCAHVCMQLCLLAGCNKQVCVRNKSRLAHTVSKQPLMHRARLTSLRGWRCPPASRRLGGWGDWSASRHTTTTW